MASTRKKGRKNQHDRTLLITRLFFMEKKNTAQRSLSPVLRKRLQTSGHWCWCPPCPSRRQTTWLAQGGWSSKEKKKGDQKSTRPHHPDYMAVFYGEKKHSAAESSAHSTEKGTNLRAVVLVPPPCSPGRKKHGRPKETAQIQEKINTTPPS